MSSILLPCFLLSCLFVKLTFSHPLTYVGIPPNTRSLLHKAISQDKFPLWVSKTFFNFLLVQEKKNVTCLTLCDTNCVSPRLWLVWIEIIKYFQNIIIWYFLLTVNLTISLINRTHYWVRERIREITIPPLKILNDFSVRTLFCTNHEIGYSKAVKVGFSLLGASLFKSKESNPDSKVVLPWFWSVELIELLWVYKPIKLCNLHQDHENILYATPQQYNSLMLKGSFFVSHWKKTDYPNMKHDVIHSIS